MEWQDKRTRHAKLVERMSETLGVDLDEAMMRGEVTPEQMDRVVTRCTGCDDPSSCSGWLDTHKTADQPPDYCRNVAFLNSLR